MTEVAKEFDLKSALAAIAKKNDAERDEWGKFQEEQRQKLSLTQKNLTNTDLKFQQGIKAVDFARQQLESLKDSDDSDVKIFELDRMAEGFALQGNYEEALKWATRDDKKAEYQAFQDAILRDDKEVCECSKQGKGTDGKGKQTIFPTMFIKDTFYSSHHGQVVNLWGCSTCPFLNAIP